MRIVLCFPVEDRHLAQIQAVAGRHEVINAGQEGVAEQLPTADVFCGHAKVPVPWPETVAAGRLQWIQSSAAGLDHCLTPEVVESPIEVTSASGLFADPVAEQALALLLAIVRRIPVFLEAQAQRRYQRLATYDLSGATVGVLGLGGNGRRLVDVLRPWNVRILATDYFADVPPPPGVEAVLPPERQEEVLRESDIVVLCVPLTPRTHHLLDAAALRAMRDDAILINVARGPVVEEAALVRELHAGRFRGAGLDVAEVEPPPADSPLWTAPRTVITPHVGAQSARRVDATVDFFCENFRRFEAGLPLWNRVDKRLGFPAPEARPPV